MRLSLLVLLSLSPLTLHAAFDKDEAVRVVRIQVSAGSAISRPYFPAQPIPRPGFPGSGPSKPSIAAELRGGVHARDRPHQQVVLAAQIFSSCVPEVRYLTALAFPGSDFAVFAISGSRLRLEFQVYQQALADLWRLGGGQVYYYFFAVFER